MRTSKDKKQWRYMMVQKAKDGIKAAARAFNTTPNVVRKWRDRFNSDGYAGLADHSRKPHISPRETPHETKIYIINLKKKYKRMGAEQIKVVEDLTMAPKTMRKIWRQAGCSSRKRPKKHVTKNNLRAIKKAFKLFERMGEDTKELDDIPEYYWQMKKHNLPAIQYTFREISCGILGLGFAQQKSLIHAQLFAIYINHYLRKYKALPDQSVRQTDNGSEYIGSWKAKESSIYTKAIESLDGQFHRTIYPGAHRMQSDVETIHNLMEMEFYEIEQFHNRLDFFNKAAAYLLYFNLHRPNSYKEHKTPWQLAQEKNPGLDKRLLMIPPVDLDQLFAWYAPILAKGGNNLLTVPSLGFLFQKIRIILTLSQCFC
jgi:transposase-like protein